MIRRPDLYGAVVCGVPLADMRRYHELLAGASWMGEYGDPDRPGRVGIHCEVFAVIRISIRMRSIRRSSSTLRHGTTGCIRAMRAR
ncbi:MAG: hypothetical protein U5O39_06265 [Gammaproteobacteria bacterium]|nr:hypothetical protein [Gammaproteobacteria bacterium]